MVSCTETNQLPNYRLFLVCLILSACSSFQNGFISSALNMPHKVIEKFVNQSNKDSFGRYLTKSEETNLWSFTVTQRQIGQFIGAFLAPFICYYVGRKGTIFINTIPLCVGLFLQFLSKFVNVWILLLIGRCIWAVGCGTIAVLIPMFLNEVAPKQFRGAMASFHGVMIDVGSLIADISGLPGNLGTERLWSCAYLIALGLQLFQLAVLPFCPESPKDLYVRQENVQKSIKSLDFYHGKSKPADNERQSTLNEFDCEKKAGGKKRLNPLKQIWAHPELRMSLFVGIGSTLSYAFGGMQIMANYNIELFESCGVRSEVAEISATVFGIVKFLAFFPSVFIVEKCGRRPLLLFSLWSCLITFVIDMLCFLIYSYWSKAPWVGYLLIVSIVSYGFLFSIGTQTIGTFFASELVPTQERSANQSVSVMCRFVAALIATYAFIPLKRSVGAYCWLIMIVPLLLVSLFMQRCMPETKNRPIIDVVYELNTSRCLFRRKQPFDNNRTDKIDTTAIQTTNDTDFDKQATLAI